MIWDRDYIKELLEAFEKHSELIKAFVNGKNIEFKSSTGNWEGFPNNMPPAFYKNVEYRIKPEPKKVKMCYEDFKDKPIVWTRDVTSPLYQAFIYSKSEIGFSTEHLYFEWDDNSLNFKEWSTDCINWNKFTKEINDE